MFIVCISKICQHYNPTVTIVHSVLGVKISKRLTQTILHMLSAILHLTMKTKIYLCKEHFPNMPDII